MDGVSTTTYFDGSGERLYTVVIDAMFNTHVNYDPASSQTISISRTYTISGERISTHTINSDNTSVLINYDYSDSHDYVTETIEVDASGAYISAVLELDTGWQRLVTYDTNANNNVIARAGEYQYGYLVDQFTYLENELTIREHLAFYREVTDETADGASGGNSRPWSTKTFYYEYGTDNIANLTIIFDNGDYKGTAYQPNGGIHAILIDLSGTKNYELRSFTRDAKGRLEDDFILYDSGTTRQRTFDDNGTLRELIIGDSSANKPFDSITHTYDVDGDLMRSVTLKDNYDEVHIQYDADGVRITRTLYDYSETRDYLSRTYTYDETGNVTNIAEVADVPADFFVL